MGLTYECDICGKKGDIELPIDPLYFNVGSQPRKQVLCGECTDWMKFIIALAKTHGKVVIDVRLKDVWKK